MKVVAVDTSILIAFFLNEKGSDLGVFEHHLVMRTIILPPIVLVESLSNHKTRDAIYEVIGGWRIMEIKEGYWLRASELRAKVLKHGFKAKTADTLIAQCCIDHNVPLITRDVDFKHYAKYGGLKLA